MAMQYTCIHFSGMYIGKAFWVQLNNTLVHKNTIFPKFSFIEIYGTKQ